MKDHDTVLARIAALKTTPTAKLKEQWTALFNTPPPPYNRRFLESRLAYRIQELAYGGLKPLAGRPLELSRANGASAAPALATQRVLIDLAVRNDEALAATARNLLAQPDIAESLSFRLVESELDAGYPLGLGDLVGISTNRAGRGRLVGREARIRGMQFVSGSGVIDVGAEPLASGLPRRLAGVGVWGVAGVPGGVPLRGTPRARPCHGEEDRPTGKISRDAKLAVAVSRIRRVDPNADRPHFGLVQGCCCIENPGKCVVDVVTVPARLPLAMAQIEVVERWPTGSSGGLGLCRHLLHPRNRAEPSPL